MKPIRDADDRSALAAWLLEGDASVRWQVLRDLQSAPHLDVQAERDKVASTGWGSRLLALQDPDGGWADALYSPKGP